MCGWVGQGFLVVKCWEISCGQQRFAPIHLRPIIFFKGYDKKLLPIRKNTFFHVCFYGALYRKKIVGGSPTATETSASAVQAAPPIPGRQQPVRVCRPYCPGPPAAFLATETEELASSWISCFVRFVFGCQRLRI